jgi:murein hydrolase activator
MFRILLLVMLSTAPLSQLWAQADSRKTEAELRAVQAEIERVRREVGRDQLKRDRLSRELRETELSAGTVRTSLEELRQLRAERLQRRKVLTEQKLVQQRELSRERASLAGQLRTAHRLGQQEPLKLLLNQRDPARVGRVFTYYSYFGRARAIQIDRINTFVATLETLEAQLVVEEQQLAILESRRSAELVALDESRRKRGKVLSDLQASTKSRVRNLERLKAQKSGLEKLLRELRRATESYAFKTPQAFSKLRGKLAWPVNGRITARFGESRAGGVKWDGVMLAADRGATVRAIAPGRMIYADWLPGLGLLAIVDHGGGYLSLYGHNDRLFKEVGEKIGGGEPLAAVGDSGGRSRPELYFEIRRAGKPVDPRPWFKSSAP